MPDYLTAYQLANYDYPFIDYLSVNWFQNDADAMERYTRTGKHPPTSVEREGPSYPLPDVLPEDLCAAPLVDSKLPLKKLAAILRYTFGKIGEIDGGDRGPWLHKTSPSGGARHPTEGFLLLGNYYDDIPAGAYAYDINKHVLVGTDRYQVTLPALGDQHFAILIRSRLERAMWRYRDIRALRPTIIDSGHIIETLSLLFDIQGLQSSLAYPLLDTSADLSWLIEPELSLLLIGPDPAGQDLAAWPQTPTIEQNLTERHITNPFLVFGFSAGQLQAKVLWPQYHEEMISYDDFAMISHALISRRGDRVTTMDGFREAFPAVTTDRISELTQRHCILPIHFGATVYSQIKIWIRYGWYLSLLAYLTMREAVSKPTRPSYPTPRSTGLATLSDENIINALMTRRTTCVFEKTSLEKPTIIRFLKSATAFLNDPTLKFNMFLAMHEDAHDDDDLLMYRWDATNKEMIALDKALSAYDIRVMSAGQACVGAGACTIWLLLDMDSQSPQRYLLDWTRLGQIGQRMCLLATSLDLGIFVTPAVCDEDTLSYFEVEQTEQKAIYSFTIGYRKG